MIVAVLALVGLFIGLMVVGENVKYLRPVIGATIGLIVGIVLVFTIDVEPDYELTTRAELEGYDVVTVPRVSRTAVTGFRMVGNMPIYSHNHTEYNTKTHVHVNYNGKIRTFESMQVDIYHTGENVVEEYVDHNFIKGMLFDGDTYWKRIVIKTE